MKKITSIEINDSDLPASSTSRVFRITGDEGAVFSVRVRTADSKYYNFVGKVFQTNYNAKTTLRNIEIKGKSYSGAIVFPADADGATYYFDVFAESHFDTELSKEVVGSFKNSDNEREDLDFNHLFYSTYISQIADVTVTIGLKADTDSEFTSATLAQTATSTQSPITTDEQTLDLNFTIQNDATDLKGFGHQLIKTTIKDSDFFNLTTQTINEPGRDASASFTNYVMDSVDNLGVGMAIHSVSAGSISGSPRVIKAQKYPPTSTVSPGEPFIKFNITQAFSDNVIITFRAYGSDNIKNSAGLEIEFQDLKLEATPLTKTVRGAISSSTTVTLNGTYGVGKSTDGTYIEGLGVNNTSNNPITGVSASSSAGSITTTVAQTLVDGTKLHVIGCASEYKLTGRAVIKKFPSANTTIYCDLSDLLRLGTAS